VSNTIAARLPARPAKPFAPQLPWDRNFFLLLVLLIWLGTLVGFGWDLIHHIRGNGRPYALIVHVHAIVFVGWLALLTAQVLLVRVRRVDLHRRLGMVGLLLAAIMPVLGLAAAWVSERGKHGTAESDPSFLAIQITMMVCFPVLVAAAYRMRSQPPAHKRLMLLSTIYLSIAGFGRWWFLAFGDVFGPGFASLFVTLNAGGDALILALGAYDFLTRGRLHPAYVAGSLWILASELFANWLYFNPTWGKAAAWLVGY
jgi:hypothetical protein